MSFQISFDLLCSDAVQLALIAKNVKKDPYYSPYCNNCSGLKRMQRVHYMYWRCDCGAVHDQRNVELNPNAVEFVNALP